MSGDGREQLDEAIEELSMTELVRLLPTLRPAPVVTPTSVIFRRTCGARTGVPAPTSWKSLRGP